MSRFSFFLPFMAPVLVVIGWWWHTSHKKKEITTPEEEEEEGMAVCEALNGMVESSSGGLKVRKRSTVGLVEENHILAATSGMLGQSLATETLGRVETSSHIRHSSLTVDPDTDCLESLEQDTPHDQAASNTGGDEAEEAEKRTSEHQSLHDDERVTEASESGSRKGLDAEQGVVTEEEGTLAPPPSHSPGAAISHALAQLTEAARPELETDRNVANESITVPFPDHLCLLPVLKDQIFTSRTPDALCPDAVMASCQVSTMIAPPSNMEAESSHQQYCHGVVLQSGLVLDPAKEESVGSTLSLNSELISVATQEALAVRPHDVSEEGNGGRSEPSNSFPQSSEPQCTLVDQVEQDNSQMSMEVLCRLEEDRVDDINEQTLNEMRPLLGDGSSLSTSVELARDEEVLNACTAPPVQEEVEEESSSGTEYGRNGVSPEDSPSSLDEPQTNVTGTEDSGCNTGQLEDPWVHQCESTGEEVDRKPSDQSSSCILDTQTETPCTAPYQAQQEDTHTSSGVQHRLQEGPISVAPTEAPGDEVSQNGSSSPPVQEKVVDDATSRSGTASLQKSLGPEATPLSRDKPQKDDDVTGTEDSGSSTRQSEDGISSGDHIPSAVPERELNIMPISAMSQNGVNHIPERKSEPSAEEGHQGSRYAGERVNDTDLQTGNHMVYEMEGDRSGEISSAALQADPVVGWCESVDDRMSPDQSSSCIPGAQTKETPCTAQDQAEQEDTHTCSGVQHRLQEGPISVAPTEAPGDEVSQNGRSSPPVQETVVDDATSRSGMASLQKSLGPEATPLSQDEPQKGDGGPFSVASAEASGNDVPRSCPVREEMDDYASGTTESMPKSPGAETTPSRQDEPQTLEDVTGTEDSGCNTCQSGDGVSSQDHTPSTVLSCTAPEREEDLTPEREEDLTPVSSASRGLEKQSKGPERKSEPSQEEGHQGTLPRGERLCHTDLQTGSVKVPETEAELSGGGGVDVNGIDSVNSGCSSETREDQGHSGQPTFPQNPDLTVWEIEVPKLLVGRLIGKRGRYVSFLKQTSGAKVFISPRPDTQEVQLCRIEGTKQQVHKALGLIRKKFKDLDLTNRHTPPPHSKLPSLPITSWLLLPDEATVEVTVVKMVSASHMFVQQPEHPSYPALSALDQDMRLCYSQPAPGLPSPTEAGVICAAPGVDGAWWRAQVISFHKECDEAEIRYVDYGGYHRVKMGTLHQIRSDFVTLPFQGAEVVLSNIKPLPGADGFSAEACAALEEMTRGASLLAQVTSYSDGGIPFIQMWKVVKDELVSVNRTLVDRGLATWLESL